MSDTVWVTILTNVPGLRPEYAVSKEDYARIRTWFQVGKARTNTFKAETFNGAQVYVTLSRKVVAGLERTRS